MNLSERSVKIILCLSLLISEGFYLVLTSHNAINGARPVWTFLGIIWALFAMYLVAGWMIGKSKNQSFKFFVIIFGAVMFRLTLLPAGLPADQTWAEKWQALHMDVSGRAVSYERFLLYDHDLWRYLWDGHVAANGVNPFRFAPLDEQSDELVYDERWMQIRDNVNHADIPTIYPPAAQAVFVLSHWIAPGSVLVWKLIVVMFDLLSVLFIALTLKQFGRSASEVAWYAWNPLVLKVFAASGHLDSIMVAALAALIYCAARRKRLLTAVVLGLAIVVKFSPVILMPFVLRRIGWRWIAVTLGIVLAAYLPFLSAGKMLFAGFGAFAQDWQFNAGVYTLLQSLGSSAMARAICGVIIIGWIAWLMKLDDKADKTLAKYGGLALGGLILLSPAVMPWYVTWLLPLAIIARQWVWLIFSALVFLAFVVLVDEIEHSWVLWLEYGILSVCILYSLRPMNLKGLRQHAAIN